MPPPPAPSRRSRPRRRARRPRPPRAAQLHRTALQRRATACHNDRALAAEMPAHFIAFDVLQHDGQELLDEPFARRREVLEALFADHRLGPPWTLCPSTTDHRSRTSGCMTGPTYPVSKALQPRA
ncbi:hypothetical protein OG488_38335 [Streptomyces sp. NBC_01460]|uniref:ATP-dependent DNA ligase n=1 Tax=Streptomyces sp. NBC_01460 TaxID=2903875 RepID=UPI002E2F71A2|nr:hypothetical protein [Streptomyces sp. NBC_01460]